MSGEGVYYTSALSFISLLKCWGRTTPGVLLLTYCVTAASKTLGWLFKNTFLLTGTRENVTDPACAREQVWVCQYVYVNECELVGVHMLERECVRWMHVEEATQTETCSSHVRGIDRTTKSKGKVINQFTCCGDISLLLKCQIRVRIGHSRSEEGVS